MDLPPTLRFPPFPTPPDGVKIVPFKDFRESGIQIFVSAANNDEEVEIDGRGVPTVSLRVKHDTDECKTNAKRKREKKKKANNEERDITRPARKLDWWEHWEDVEHLRVFNYDHNLSRVDRVFQAVQDFKTNRTWPPAPFGAQTIWDQFRNFIGVLSRGSRKAPNDKTPGAMANADDDDVDDEAFSDEETTHTAHDSKITSTVDYDDDVTEQKDDKLEAFLNNPEHAIKVFLSSFMRKQGLIWSDRNLTSAPVLISFFLRFLQRNRVLPELTHERGLRNALAIVDLAAKELPLTAKIARALPDTFNKACVACWGERAEGYRTFGAKEVVDEVVDENQEDGERVSKRQKVSDKSGIDNPGLSLGTATEVDAEAKAIFEAELKSANVEILRPGEATLDVNAADAVAANNINTDGGAWVGGEGWGDDEDKWSDDGNTWDAITPAGAAADSSLWVVVYDPLMIFLGPTVFPLTHAAGVVELSVRRIKDIRPVGAETGVSAVGRRASAWQPNAEGVEAGLEDMFGKVVFGPWLGWNGGEEVNMSKPRILKSSKGAVVGGPGASETGGVKPHDPAHDDIVVLVEPSVLETLSVGMGLGATWVQLVRQEQVQDAGKKGKKGKGKGKKAEARYWYVEEVTMILPSYYTP